jgi:hypothetical protein
MAIDRRGIFRMATPDEVNADMLAFWDGQGSA